nr:7041_t:CDS:2 [Entrophospora candida]
MTTTTGNEEFGYEVLVKNKLLKVQHDLSSDFSVQTLTVPVKHHWHIIGPKRSTLNTIIYNDGSNGGVIGAYSPVSLKDLVKEVEKIIEGINEKVEDAKRIENLQFQKSTLHILLVKEEAK